MVRWDQSAECRAVIERGNRAAEAWKSNRAQFKEQDIRTNEIWHDSNLDMLQTCVGYLRHKQYRAFELLWHCFCGEESRRLGERACMMELHKIVSLPHKHKAREKALLEEMGIVLERGSV